MQQNDKQLRLKYIIGMYNNMSRYTRHVRDFHIIQGDESLKIPLFI